MTSCFVIKIKRNDDTMEPESFYQFMNACAEKQGIRGQVSISRHTTTYKFRLQGPTASLERFLEFVEFVDGPLGTVISIQEVEPQPAEGYAPDALAREA